MEETAEVRELKQQVDEVRAAGEEKAEETSRALTAIGESGGSTAVAREVMSDDEIRRMYRLAEALWASGAYKDVKKAEQAFTKMLVGREMGMSPSAAMSGLHLVDGGITVHYSMLGNFVRQHPGYQYRPGWLKIEPRIVLEGEEPPAEDAPPSIVAVWLDEEDPADLREVFGAFVEFSRDGERIGISRFTYDDAVQANLIKEGLDKRAAWNTSRRNMYLARSMSNGVKWLVPEVMNGIPTYVPGEVDDKPDLMAPTGSGEAQGIDLGPKVDAVIERAEKLGHAGLSNRATLELALGGRSPAAVNKFVREATAELNEFEKAQGGEVEDAQVVDESTAELASTAEQIADELGDQIDGERAPEAKVEHPEEPEEVTPDAVEPEPEQLPVDKPEEK